ncbi:hypothetical protein [Streptomyces lavendulae]|uniref:hypothetical protein n=1 Tax=Streptomyces lavendulae TaxID=1914 RepID=UPI0031EC35F5
MAAVKVGDQGVEQPVQVGVLGDGRIGDAQVAQLPGPGSDPGGNEAEAVRVALPLLGVGVVGEGGEDLGAVALALGAGLDGEVDGVAAVAVGLCGGGGKAVS